jgi:hypothetical protein
VRSGDELGVGHEGRRRSAASLKDVERARGGRDVGPGDGGAVREGLEQRDDGDAGVGDGALRL